METKELAFTRQYETAVAVIAQAKAMTVSTAEEHASATGKLNEIRALEKELDAQYKADPYVIEAKRRQAIKIDLAEMLENARKTLKNGPMLRFEQMEEDKRRAEERRLQVIAEAAAKAEYDRQQAERKAVWEAQEKERKAAEAAQAKAKAAMAKAKDAEAAREAFYAAQEVARRAAAQAEATRQEAIQAKQDQAQAVVPTVVVAKTAPTVARRTLAKFEIVDAMKLPRQYLKPDEVAIGGVVRSLKMNANIPGIRVWEETV